jgi:hypothetical protein
MQCKELESVLADALSPLPREAREHLAGCAACRDLLADFSAIVSAAKHIPAEVNPPDRVWVALRAQLAAEGIIRETVELEPVPVSSWWRSFQQLFRPRLLAWAAATFVVAAGGVYLVQQRSALRTNTPPPVINANASKINLPQTAQTENVFQSAPPPAPSTHRLVSTQSASAPQIHESHTVLAPSPSDNLRIGDTARFGDTAAVLSETEHTISTTHSLTDNAAVDAALRENLRTLNEFISECEARLKQNPQDQLTREYLNMAYQQKAELLNAMLDSGRSEN